MGASPYKRKALTDEPKIKKEITLMLKLKDGIRTKYSDDNGGVAWKLFANESGKTRDEMNHCDIEDIINESGFTYSDNGPGGYFANIAGIRITRSKILIRLRFGLDI
jgi:hypothetical protein